MIQKISLLTIVFAIVYALVYLKSGTFSSTAGILVIIIFSWLGLRGFEIDEYHWGIWHYLTGLWVLYYIGVLIYGSVNVLSAAIEFNFITKDIILNLLLTNLLCILVILQFILFAYKNYKQIKS